MVARPDPTTDPPDATDVLGRDRAGIVSFVAGVGCGVQTVAVPPRPCHAPPPRLKPQPPHYTGRNAEPGSTSACCMGNGRLQGARAPAALQSVQRRPRTSASPGTAAYAGQSSTS